MDVIRFDIPTPITFALFPFLIIGLFLNALIVWLFLSNKANFGKVLTSSVIAYFFLAAFGLCITFYYDVSTNFLWFLFYYALAVVIQYLVFIPYFNEVNFNKFKLAFSSFIANTIVFAILTYMTFYKVGVVEHYIDLVKISLSNQGITF